MKHNAAKRSLVNPKSVKLVDFPQLAAIAWNQTRHAVPEQEAFALYERNWRFIDPQQLTRAERLLIARLTKKYGSGIIHANVSPSAIPSILSGLAR